MSRSSERKTLSAIGSPAQTRSSRATMRALPVARAGMVAKTVASPAPMSSSSAVCTSRCTYSESQFIRKSSRVTIDRSVRGFQLLDSFAGLGQFNSPVFQCGLQSQDNFLWCAAAESFVAELPFFRGDVFCQAFRFFFQAYQFR